MPPEIFDYSLVFQVAATSSTSADGAGTMIKIRVGRSVYVPESSLAGVTDRGVEATALQYQLLAERP